MAFFDFQMTLGEAHLFRSSASAAMFINMYVHLQNIFNCCQMFLRAPDLWFLWIKQYQVPLVYRSDLALTVKAATFHISIILLLLTPHIVDRHFSLSLFFLLLCVKVCSAYVISKFFRIPVSVCLGRQGWVLTNTLHFSLKKCLRDHTSLWQCGACTWNKQITWLR